MIIVLVGLSEVYVYTFESHSEFRGTMHQILTCPIDTSKRFGTLAKKPVDRLRS